MRYASIFSVKGAWILILLGLAAVCALLSYREAAGKDVGQMILPNPAAEFTRLFGLAPNDPLADQRVAADLGICSGESCEAMLVYARHFGYGGVAEGTMFWDSISP